MQIDDYFKDVVEEIRQLQIVVSENIIFDKRSKYTGRITGFFIFIDESVIHFSEFIVIKNSGRHLTRPSYRFHWQDRNGNLIRRYDNAPHFPRLDNFPHHVHYPDLVESFREIGVVEVLDIVETEL